MVDFHDMLGFDRVYDESFEYIFPIFQKLGVKQNYTIASESGYFVHLMNKNGIPSRGSDIFSGIVQLSKHRYPHIDFSLEDMRDFTLQEPVDLITCMDGCINHVFSLDEVEETFSSVYKNLEDRGYFYFEFWTEEEVSDKHQLVEKKFKLEGYDILQRERRVGNNIHNMLTKIMKDGKVVDILNAYHTSFLYEEVIERLEKVGFKKIKEFSFSNKFSKKILAFKY